MKTTIDKSRVFKTAWRLLKYGLTSFSCALKVAWRYEKGRLNFKEAKKATVGYSWYEKDLALGRYLGLDRKFAKMLREEMNLSPIY